MSKPTNRDLQSRLDNGAEHLRNALSDEWQSDEFLRDTFREWLLYQLGDERPDHRWSWRNQTLLQLSRLERSQKQDLDLNDVRRDARTYEGWKGTRRRNNDGEVVLPARQVEQGEEAAFHIFMLGKRYGEEGNDKTYKPMPRFLYDDTIIPVTELRHLDAHDSDLFEFYWPARIGFAEAGPFEDINELKGVDSFGDLVYQRKDEFAQRLLQCDDIDRSNVEEAISSIRNKFGQYAALFRTQGGQYRVQTASDVIEADESLLDDITERPDELRAGAERFVRAWDEPETVFAPPEVKTLQKTVRDGSTKELHQLAHTLSQRVSGDNVSCGEDPQREASAALTTYLLSMASGEPVSKRDVVQGYAPYLEASLEANYNFYEKNSPTESDWAQPGLNNVMAHSLASTSSLYDQQFLQTKQRKNTRTVST